MRQEELHGSRVCRLLSLFPALSDGTFDVTLVVTNALGCTDTLRETAYITIRKPVITFTSLPDEGCVPYGINFNATVNTTEPVISYLWDFGNGITSTLPTPSHTYTSQGTYNVSLTVTTASGCTEKYTMPDAVIVGTKPVVSFSAEPREVCAFKPVSFNNLTPTTGNTQFFWLQRLQSGVPILRSCCLFQ